MISIVLGFFLLFSTSLSLAEREVEINEVDEIQEVIEETQTNSKAETDSFLKELNEAGHAKLGLKALSDPRIKEVISKQFDDSNISLMSLDKKRRYFNEQFKNSLVKEFIEKVPKLRDIFVDVVTDKDSMLGLVSIFQKEKERTYILYIVIGAFILGLILKKLIISSESNFFYRLIQRVAINLFSMLLSTGMIFYLFQKELTPIVKIIKSHF